MRWIFNFVFYGMIFYLINYFFPDFFQILVGWADQVVVWVQDIYAQVLEKISQSQAAQ